MNKNKKDNITNKKLSVAILPGDGIGQEVVPVAVNILKIIIKKYKIPIKLFFADIGDFAFRKTGKYFPHETKKICDQVDAILFGAVNNKPLLELRKRYDFFANIRPVKGKKVNLILFRELTGDIYFGASGVKLVNGEKKGYHTMEYSEREIKRIAQIAFSYASKHHQNLISIDKDNALPKIKWRKTVEKIAKKFPEVKHSHIYIDNALAQLYRYPQQFQVVLSSNLFGDIFSDLAAEMAGGIGKAASISINEQGKAFCEPVHGTAPDIAGKGIADPTGAIISIKLLLEHWGFTTVAQQLNNAVNKTTTKFYKGKEKFSTKKFTNILLKNLQNNKYENNKTKRQY